MLTIGQSVPDFTAVATSGQTVSLSALRGRAVVIYFYPKDSTPGCTLEAQDFRDHYAEFKMLNIEIIGVSRDSLKSHERFKCAQTLPFELIADTDAQLCQLFDVIKPKLMYGKTVEGIERSTFLIDANGQLRAEWRKVKVPGHCLNVLAAVRNLPDCAKSSAVQGGDE